MSQPLHTETETDDMEMDFATLLEESLQRPLPERGDIVKGIVLAIDQQGMLVDVGLKRDGSVNKQDIERLGSDVEFEVGQEINVMIIRVEDHSGNAIVSVSQALQAVDWDNAEQLLEDDAVWEGTVIEANRGGLIVPFGNLRGFIPASHINNLPRSTTEQERQQYMDHLVGEPITVKVLEVNRKRRRLVFSQREAMREQRVQIKEQLMEELKEGDVREGIVSGLRDFGAFVDLGGADGLIHISELAWHRVQHPSEIVSVGDKVEVYVMHLDEQDRRIGLSLKRLQENPWSKIDERYHIGQLVMGEVSRVAPYGVFVRLNPGIEALLHSSQICDPQPDSVEGLVDIGQRLLLRIISIEAERQRLGLSYKEVTEVERENWAEENEIAVDSLRLDLSRLGQESFEAMLADNDDIDSGKNAEDPLQSTDVEQSVAESV
ncbi:MAG: S1 RNA-binding domain-containing protein [Chloroflexi bacterium]|nr:S1 RNA-binding domain-containing protein [Chloroflexota bacterium]